MKSCDLETLFEFHHVLECRCCTKLRNFPPTLLTKIFCPHLWIMADLSEVECHKRFFPQNTIPNLIVVSFDTVERNWRDRRRGSGEMCGKIVLHLLIIGMLEVLNCSFLDTNGMNGWGLGWYNVGINPN